MSPQATNTKSSVAWVVVLTAIGSFMGALDTLVVSTALPTIRLDLGAPPPSSNGPSMLTTSPLRSCW